MADHSMVAGDDRLLACFPSGVPFTYSYTSMNSKIYINFILLLDCVSSAVHDYAITDYPLNLSDHLPVCLAIDWQNTSLDTGLQQSRNESGSSTTKDKTAETISCLRWDHANLERYRNSTVNFLSPILNDIEMRYGTLINNSDCHYHPLDELCALCIQRKSETHACNDKW